MENDIMGNGPKWFLEMHCEMTKILLAIKAYHRALDSGDLDVFMEVGTESVAEIIMASDELKKLIQITKDDK